MTTRILRVTTAAIALAMIACTTSLNAQVIVQPAGVEVDAQGLLQTRVFQDPTGELTKLRINAAKQHLDPNLQNVSKMRMISLQRFEAAIKEKLDAGESLTPDMKYMAGLTSITHVFYYPESKDIVIAGPAEGFYQNLAGRVVGIDSGKPVLTLEDFCVALRAYPATGEKTRVIACSIDPTQEGSKRLQETHRAIAQSGSFRPGNEAEVVTAFREALGNQNITIKGISPKTRFAQVLIEADYRMKLIGIGLEQPAVKFKSFVEAVNPRSGAGNQLQRWYFIPDYDTIKVSEDELAMELVGQGAKLVGANELVRRDGSRVQSAKPNRASKGFTVNFTKKFPKLAEKTPIFAELKNMIDLSIVAAYIQEMDYYGQSGWEMAVLGDEAQIPTEIYNEPKQVEPAINALWKNGLFMTPIGGGVNIQPRQALTADHMKYDETSEVDRVRSEVKIDGIADGQWWWE